MRDGAGQSFLWNAGEKEYYLASCFSEFYAAPSASFALRGLAVSGQATHLSTGLLLYRGSLSHAQTFRSPGARQLKVMEYSKFLIPGLSSTGERKSLLQTVSKHLMHVCTQVALWPGSLRRLA